MCVQRDRQLTQTIHNPLFIENTLALEKTLLHEQLCRRLQWPSRKEDVSAVAFTSVHFTGCVITLTFPQHLSLQGPFTCLGPEPFISGSDGVEMEQASEARGLLKATDLSSRYVSKCETTEYFCQKTNDLKAGDHWIFPKETYSDFYCGDRSRYIKHLCLTLAKCSCAQT